jgi:hypothetical protein
MFEHSNPECYRAELAALGFARGNGPRPGAATGRPAAELFTRELAAGALAVYALSPEHSGEPSWGELHLYPSAAAYCSGGPGELLISGESAPAECLAECWPGAPPECPAWAVEPMRELYNIGAAYCERLAELG